MSKYPRSALSRQFASTRYSSPLQGFCDVKRVSDNLGTFERTGAPSTRRATCGRRSNSAAGSGHERRLGTIDATRLVTARNGSRWRDSRSARRGDGLVRRWMQFTSAVLVRNGGLAWRLV